MHPIFAFIVCVPISSPPSTAVAEIVVPEGFEVDLLHVASADEGSWSAMTIDDRGRIVVSPQSGPLLRITPSEDLAEPAKVDRLHDRVGRAQGLLAVGHDLFVNVAADPARDGGLWRLRDLDDDDAYEVVERLAGYGSGSEHGPHGLVLGPDGHLWMVNGNYSSLPEDLRSPSPFAGWLEDDVLERIWDPRGHAHGIHVPGGVLLRTDLEAREWEIVAGGMRNPYDLDFNADGELFTYDADMEWDIGTPWYRSPRLLHLVSGAEYGWRSGSSKWPIDSPDAFPAVLEMDAGSPTGVASGHRSAFPAPWNRSMFLGDWAYGRILAVELEPDGGTYTGEPRTFLSGRPLNVTDFDFGPHGDLYLVTGGRGSQSALYRVRWIGPSRPDVARFDGDAADVRTLRRDLERAHRRPGAIEFERLVYGLGDRDGTIRRASRVGLEHWLRGEIASGGVASITDALATLRDLPADQGGWEALLACMHVFDASRVGELSRWLERLADDDDSAEGERWLGRLAGVMVSRFGGAEVAVGDRLRDRLGQVFPGQDPATDRHLIDAMVVLGGDDVAATILDSVDGTSSSTELMHRLHAISQLDGSWSSTLDARIVDLLLELGRTTGGASHAGYVDTIEDRIRPHLDAAVAVRLDAERGQDGRTPADAEVRRLVRRWEVGDFDLHLSRALAGRDHARGRSLYDDLQCSACHKVGDHGIAYGPDLTGVGGRFGLRDILVATLQPERDLSDQYEALLLETEDGDRHLGLVVERGDDAVILAPDPRLGTGAVVVPSGAIVRETVASPMPSGLLDTADMDGVLDLLAYLISGGNADDPVFLAPP